MMRRGGRGSIVQAPRRGHDHGIPISSLHLDRGLGARNYVKVIVLAVCSIAISIIIWRSRPGRPPGAHLLVYNLRSRNPGFVFPLYRYYVPRFPNGSHVVGGRERWRRSRVGFHGRRIRSEEPKPLFELHGGRRIDDGLEIEDFYIKMKLGDPPKPFHFHIDTASGPPSWVYCNDLGRYGSSIHTLGPNGLFVPEGNSFVKCTGETASLCLTLQAAGEQECNRKYDYDCLFASKYLDGSTYWGRVVNGSITLPMIDRNERKVFGLFGCAFEKEGDTETKPLITDGVIGLGNCKGTLADQLSTSNDIGQNVLGVCLAKGMISASSAAPVGFISLGMDFEQKFNHQSHSLSNWVKLLDQPGVLCAYGAKLLYIFVDRKRITVRFSGKTVGMAMYFDTGSDLTYLHKDMYDQVLSALDTYATNRAYVRKEDNEYLEGSEQRVCWEPPAKKRKTRGKSVPNSSPYHDFGPLKLAFEGIASAMQPAPLQYLIIQPVNYLIWDEDEIKLCVNILQDIANEVSNLGADIMRENLFVFDVDNQRVRWTANSNCDI